MINWLGLIFVIGAVLLSRKGGRALPIVITLYYLLYMTYDWSFGFWEHSLTQAYELGEFSFFVYDLGSHLITLAAILFITNMRAPGGRRFIFIGYSLWLSITILVNSAISIAFWYYIEVPGTLLAVWALVSVGVDVVAAYAGSSNFASDNLFVIGSRNARDRSKRDNSSLEAYQ